VQVRNPSKPQLTSKLCAKTMMKSIFILFVMLIASAQAVSNEDFEWMLSRQEIIDSFVRKAPLFIEEKSLEGLRKLGKLKNEIVKKTSNRHNPNKKDEFRTLIFKGLEIYGYVHSSQELWLIQIIITKSDWKILNDLNVGSPAERIFKVLGKPDKEIVNMRQYHGETETIRSYITSDKIKKIVLNYYFD